jgi:hypothetical protein
VAQRQACAAFRQGDLRAKTRHTKMEHILKVELANFNKIDVVRVRKQAHHPITAIGGNSNWTIRGGERLVSSTRRKSRGGTFGSSSGIEPTATNLRGPLAAFATQPRYSTYVAQDGSGKHQPRLFSAKPAWSTWTQQLQTKQAQQLQTKQAQQLQTKQAQQLQTKQAQRSAGEAKGEGAAVAAFLPPKRSLGPKSPTQWSHAGDHTEVARGRTNSSANENAATQQLKPLHVGRLGGFRHGRRARQVAPV